MEPPPVRNKRTTARARLTNAERRQINEYGLNVPSKNSENYEPNLNSHVVLWNAGTLPGTRPYNYRNKAVANQKKTWEGYLKQRAAAEAAAKAKNKGYGNNTRKNNKRNKGKNGNNNGTRRALF